MSPLFSRAIPKQHACPPDFVAARFASVICAESLAVIPPMLDFDSATAGRPVTTHKLYFVYYWHIKQLHPNGQRTVSPPIKAGGCSWRIHCYPNGVSSSCKDYISIFMALDSRVAMPIKAWTRFSLLDLAGNPVAGHPVYTDVREYSEVGDRYGCDVFIRKKFLEASGHLFASCFKVGWEICVDWATPLQQHPLDTDVMLQVGGAVFSAHMSVLAQRSPALEAELFSATREGATAGDCIRIDGILPQVFKSLLHFIYTDSLSEMTGIEETAMTEHLLVVADRFDMQELKNICEDKLCENINEDTIAELLRFDEQHHCRLLRDACVEFLEDPPVLQAVMATNDDDGLVELVAKSCPEHLMALWADDEDDSMQEELLMCF